MSVNREELYRAIGELDEALLERSERASSGKKGLRRLLLAVACMGLLIMGVRETIDRLDLFRMGCSTIAGTLVDGVYYYREGHNGLWQYTPEDGSRKIIREWDMDGWQVNTYGVYYSQGRSLYVREHESGKKRCLFKTGFWESSFINFSLQEDGNVVVSVHNTRKKTIYQVLLDGVTGAVLEQVTDVLPYPGYEGLLYSEAHFQVGDRQITLVPMEGKNDCDVMENGVSLLKEGESVNYWMGTYYGDNLFLRFRDEENPMFVHYLVLRPDGNDSELVSIGGIPLTGTNDYLFSSLDPRVYGGDTEPKEPDRAFQGDMEAEEPGKVSDEEAEKPGKVSESDEEAEEPGKVSEDDAEPEGQDRVSQSGTESGEEDREDGDEIESVGYAYDTVWCMEIATGEYWQLEIEMGDLTDNSAGRKVLAYDMETDGELLFTCAPWRSEQMCWQIIYDEAGRPKALRLVSGDIRKE